MNEKSIEKAVMKGYLKATGAITLITMGTYYGVFKAWNWYEAKIDEARKLGRGERD